MFTLGTRAPPTPCQGLSRSAKTSLARKTLYGDSKPLLIYDSFDWSHFCRIVWKKNSSPTRHLVWTFTGLPPPPRTIKFELQSSLDCYRPNVRIAESSVPHHQHTSSLNCLVWHCIIMCLVIVIAKAASVFGSWPIIWRSDCDSRLNCLLFQ